MLKINHIYVEFASKVVFNDATFIAHPNEITVFIGESGTGKTTLFQCILLRLSKDSEYYFYHTKIHELDEKEKEEYLLDCISYASQNSIFIADLTMRDQIKLLKDIYGSDYDVHDLIQLFELENVLDSYPKQLSGGEKSRFAFILSLLKNADIYMFDEPTSALDDVQTNHIIEILDNLKKQGKIVILSTHDYRLIQKGDRVYEIENQILKIRKEEESIPITHEKQVKKYEIKKLHNYWHKMKLHHKLYNRIMNIVVAFGIVVALVGLQLGMVFKDSILGSNDNDTTLFVSKEPYKDIGYNAEESLQFSDDDIELMKNVEHVEAYYPHMEYFFARKLSYYNENKDYYVEFKLDNKKQLHKINIDDETEDVQLYTYPENLDLSDKIEETWNEEGIYISKSYYEKFLENNLVKTSEDKKKVRIKVPLFVPQYNVMGSSWGGIPPNFNDMYRTNSYNGVFVEKEFKIKGVLKNEYMFHVHSKNISTNGCRYTFAISNKEMEKYIQEFKVKEAKMCFYHWKAGKQICNEPLENYLDEYGDFYKDERPPQPIDYTPYTPNTYIVKVDDYRNLAKVKVELKKIGFGVYGGVEDVTNYEIIDSYLRKIIMVVGCSTALLIILMYIFLKINNKEEEKSFGLFFREKGFNKKMIHKMNSQRFFSNVVSTTGYVVMEYVVLNILLMIFFGIILVYDYYLLLIMAFILIVTSEYIIPLILEKYYMKTEEN